MVGKNDLWLELQNCAGGLLHFHGIGRVHADKSDVDVFQFPHFRDVFGVPRDVNPHFIEIYHITITAPLVVKPGSVGRQIIHGDGFDGDCSVIGGAAVCKNIDFLLKSL